MASDDHQNSRGGYGRGGGYNGRGGGYYGRGGGYYGRGGHYVTLPQSNPQSPSIIDEENLPTDDTGNFTFNEKGTVALTAKGVGSTMVEQSLRGASLVVLASQLIGPRTNPARPIPSVGRGGHRIRGRGGRIVPIVRRGLPSVSQQRTGEISYEKLTELMNAVLAEAEAMNDMEAYCKQMRDLVVLIFHCGDLEGRGERQLFIWMLLNLLEFNNPLLVSLLPLIPEFTCWRTLRTLYDQAKAKCNEPRIATNEELMGMYNRVLNRIVELWSDQLFTDSEKLRKYNEKRMKKEARKKLETVTATTLTSTEGNADDSDDGSENEDEETKVTAKSTTVDVSSNTNDSSTSSSNTVDGGSNSSSSSSSSGTLEPKKPKVRRGPPISLAAKWAPTIGGGVDKHCELGVAIAKALANRLGEKGIPDVWMGKGNESKGTTSSTASTSSSASATGNTGSSFPPKDNARTVPSTTVSGTEPMVKKARNATTTVASSSSNPSGSTRSRRFAPESRVQNNIEKMYRKMLSALREALQVTERLMCNNRWEDINPTQVPSLANKKYAAALMNRVGSVTIWPRNADRDSGHRAGLDLSTVPGGSAAQRSTDTQRMELRNRMIEAAKNSLSVNLPEGVSAEQFTKLRGKQIKGARNQPHELVNIVLKELQQRSALDELRAAGLPEDEIRMMIHHSGGRMPTGDGDVDLLTEAMWADLIRSIKAKGVFSKPIIPLVDVSGSMEGLPMQVAISLGILSASLNKEDSPWFGKVLTFHEDPSWFDLSGVLPSANGGSLFGAVNAIMKMPWGGSTNFGKALRLLLDAMVEAKVPAEMAPSTLLCFSDMNFDEAAKPEGQVLPGTTIDGLQGVENRDPFNLAGKDILLAFDEAGYPRPTVVFWNLRADGEVTFQSDANTPGLIMVSGFSPEIMRQVCETGIDGMLNSIETDADDGTVETKEGGTVESSKVVKTKKAPTAWEVLQKTLDSERYGTVRQMVDVNEDDLKKEEEKKDGTGVLPQSLLVQKGILTALKNHKRFGGAVGGGTTTGGNVTSTSSSSGTGSSSSGRRR